MDRWQVPSLCSPAQDVTCQDNGASRPKVASNFHFLWGLSLRSPCFWPLCHSLEIRTRAQVPKTEPGCQATGGYIRIRSSLLMYFDPFYQNFLFCSPFNIVMSHSSLVSVRLFVSVFGDRRNGGIDFCCLFPL